MLVAIASIIGVVMTAMGWKEYRDSMVEVGEIKTLSTNRKNTTIMQTLYKLSKSIIPCVLLTLCIGFCYAFSIFSPHVAENLGVSRTAVQFAFCLNIFFLGMGAAFFGSLVEKNIKLAAFLSTVLLGLGLGLSGLSMHTHSLWQFYLGMGLTCGLSEGIGYVVPVKNLLLWNSKSKRKGLITAISIISFGLGSTLCSFLFKLLFPEYGIEGIFWALGGIYMLMSSLGVILIDKPKYAKISLKKNKAKRYSVRKYMNDGFFRRSWLFMFLNISMGLILIGSCANMLKETNFSQSAIITIMMLCGLFNGGGRLVFPFASDFMKKRLSMWLVILGLEMAIIIPSLCIYSLIPITIILINATYGAGFATLPSVLSDHYGNSELSFVHGICLSAWGIASLFAYVCTTFVLGFFNGYYGVLFVLAAIYALNYWNVHKLTKLK